MKEKIVGFFDAIFSDRELAEKLVEFAAENGYSFTVEELWECCEARPVLDQEVEGAQGGFTHFPLLPERYTVIDGKLVHK